MLPAGKLAMLPATPSSCSFAMRSVIIRNVEGVWPQRSIL
jgi:hypothetical protein